DAERSLHQVDLQLASRLVRDFDPSLNLPDALEVFSFGALVDSGSLPALLHFDPRFDPAEGSSSLSSSSLHLLNETISP
ncbi:hypothetical protein Tco_1222766, partial [Tanacetum coccineum]